MLSAADNEVLTRTGPGTPMGEYFRRYWLPLALAEELPERDGPPKRIRMLGEELVAFRDTQGRVGLIEPACAHRGAPLFFGRNEEGGLRCIYHGWKFDTAGRCLEMPNRPTDRDYREKLRATAYRCAERHGIVWAYMGPLAEPPGPPDLGWSELPEGHKLITKQLLE